MNHSPKKTSPKTNHTQLQRAARIAINTVLRVKPDETVLIVTNPVKDTLEISQALYQAVVTAKANPTLMIQEIKTQLDFAEPSVYKAMRSHPDVIISISDQKIGKDRDLIEKPVKVGNKTFDTYLHYLLGTKKCRSFWSPSISLDTFLRAVPVDYPRLWKRCQSLKKLMDQATEVHITTKKGMDLVIGLKGRKTFTDDGNFSKPGSGGNLPAGEAYISPAIGTAQGILVIDGSLATDDRPIVVKKPVRCVVENGFITSITGGKEARDLASCLGRAVGRVNELEWQRKITKTMAEEYRKYVYHLGELGIGLNPNARIVGKVIEDEKVLTTCHIAIGNNYDNDAHTLTHFDCVFKNPTLVLNLGKKEKMIMKEGKLLV